MSDEAFVEKLRAAQANKDSDPAQTRTEPLPEGSARVYFTPPPRKSDDPKA